MPVRSAIVPIEHLRAELWSAPLTYPTAMLSGMTALHPNLHPQKDESRPTYDLWREVERSLLERFPGVPIDELVTRRDKLWFSLCQSDSKPRGQPIELHEYYCEVAQTILPRELIAKRTPLGRMVFGDESTIFTAKEADTERQKRRQWKWLTFALPPDLLLAAAHLPSEGTRWLSRSVQSCLAEKAFCETHLHLKAAVSFPTLWLALQIQLANPDAAPSMLSSPGAEFSEGRRLAEWLLRAVIVRWLLGAFLYQESRQPQQTTSVGFRTFFLESLERLRLTAERELLVYDMVVESLKPPTQDAACDSGVASFRLLQGLYRQLTGIRTGQIPESSDPEGARLHVLDPLAAWFPPTNACPEYQFAWQGIAYLKSNHVLSRRYAGQRFDEPFARLFWQYQRARVAFYRHIVQRPMVPGLQWFTRTYGRLREPRQPLPLSRFVHEAVDLCQTDSGAAGAAVGGLQSIEVRIIPPQSLDAMLSLLRSLANAAQPLWDPARQGRQTEFGIVFHFARSRRKPTDAPAAWNQKGHGNPADNDTKWAYGDFFCAQEPQAQTLVRTLRRYPETLQIVRGVDLCADELSVPLWVMLPLVQRVRDAGLSAAHQLGKMDWRLRVTVHAGEDFVDLLGGLRRVDEVIEHLPLEDGDRIGHGVALGVEPMAWANSHSEVPMLRGERLLDLLWAWETAKTCPDLLSWLPRLESEIESIATEVFKGNQSLGQLSLLVRALHCPGHLEALGFPSPMARMGACEETHGLSWRWLRNAGLFERRQEPIQVKVRDFGPLLVGLQAHIRRKVAHRGLVVEVNPSSNLLIAQLGELEQHPLWRLRPPRPVPGNPPPVKVCIGSDDPITFATRLPEEYQLLRDALLDGELAACECDAWLDEARRAGLISRFTLPGPYDTILRTIGHPP